MSEQPTTEQSPLPPTAAQDSAAGAADSRPRPDRDRDRVGSVSKGVLLAVIFAAGGIVAWQWYDTRNQVAALEQVRVEPAFAGGMGGRGVIGLMLGLTPDGGSDHG